MASVDSADDADGQPLVAAASARLLAATALAVFPNTALTDPTIEDRHDAHPATLRRAIAFVDENAHTDIALADIAAAAQVTVRAIQLVFRRHLGVTPMAYLSRVRLEHAHNDLRSAAPGAGSVSAIAYQWGFTSSSRFAALYRRAYGVTPGHTLRQD
jgi:transcriptional regulator GlxA family with amidase domain